MSTLGALTICSGAIKSGMPRAWPSLVSAPSTFCSRDALARPKSRILIVALSPACEHQVSGLNVAVHEPLLTRVRKTKGCLMDEVVRVAHWQRSLGLDHAREIKPMRATGRLRPQAVAGASYSVLFFVEQRKYLIERVAGTRGP
jgi:hypothetical protein